MTSITPLWLALLLALAGARPALAGDVRTGAWEPAKIVDEAMRWKNMFEDEDYVAAHIEDFKLGQKRFVERYQGAKESEYMGYISGFYPVEKDGKFLPLTGVGCSRFVWAIFKAMYPDRHFDFLNSGSMYDLIKVTLDHPAGTSRDILFKDLSARVRRKAEILGEDEEFVAVTLDHLDVFTVVRDPADVKAGDIAIWVSGEPFVEKGHVGIVADPAGREYVGANGPETGITVEPYVPSEGHGKPGAFFLRWNGVAPSGGIRIRKNARE